MDRDEDSTIPEPSAAAREAELQCTSAYNKLTGLMAAGKGDTPEAQAAYKAYKEAKDKYEAILKSEIPASDSTPPPPPMDSGEVYQQYISAYNKLNYLMSRHEGGTPQAQAAYKAYEEAKDRWEAVSRAEGITGDGFSSAEPAEEAGEPAGEEPPSLQEAYDRYIAAYNQLTKLAVEARISGPPEIKKLSDEYHENLEKYNTTQDRNAYQAYIAAYNSLVGQATRIEFTGPENLRQAQQDYFQAKAAYDNLVKQSQ